MNGPHQGQPVRTAGAPLTRARAAMVMLHGRGATPESILSLVPALDAPDFAYLAPQAGGNSWWPHSFLAPIASNEPWISSAMASVADVLRQAAAAGIPPERTFLLGFSQGACLAAEFAARHARRYGGVAALSGGLIGPDGTPRNYAGSLEGTPAFLGCSDVDSHIPAARVRESAEVLRKLGGEVTMRLYPGMGHLINEDEISAVHAMMGTAAQPSRP
ncbi:MAG: phospholipase/carboxylesterase [Gemmatimonadales bacterium]|nr:phospholipase/carboxylesterase [Gemmatimonadales bacterium]